MKKQKGGGVKVLEGVIAGAVLGVLGGILFAPKSGKQTRKDAKSKTADFFRFIAPQIKNLKRLGEKEYKAFVTMAAHKYGGARRFSKKEVHLLASEAMKSWKHIAHIAKHVRGAK